MCPSSVRWNSTGASVGPSVRPWVSTLAPISERALSNSMMLVSSREVDPFSRSSCMEWCSVSSASSSWVRVAWHSKGCANSEVSERVLDRWVVCEDAVQRGELQDHAHLLVWRCEAQVAPVAAYQLE